MPSRRGNRPRRSRRSDVVRDDVDHIKSTVPLALGGMKVAFDCANGYRLPALQNCYLRNSMQECHMLSDTPDGVNINTACGSTHMEALMDYVRRHHLDAGIAFDGDADRCLAVDENGNLIDGDALMAICSLDMKSRGKLEKDAAVGTIMSNLGFIRFCEKNGIKFAATKVGDRYVLEEMLLERYNFGGEQSGHIIFHDFATTGDGQLTAAQLLCILRRREAKLSSLASVMEKYPQVLVNIHVAPDGKTAFLHGSRMSKWLLKRQKQPSGTRGVSSFVRPAQNPSCALWLRAVTMHPFTKSRKRLPKRSGNVSAEIPDVGFYRSVANSFPVKSVG